MKKVILAFSGGLDTTYCLIYLRNQGYDVVTVSVNTGGFSADEIAQIEEKANRYGAHKHYAIDATQQLYDRYTSYVIKANYLRGGVYPPCVGPERAVIASEMVAVAEREGTTTFAHGSTGAGGDQIRFAVALRALLPQSEIIAPIRDQHLTREQEYSFLRENGVEIAEQNKDYSINISLMGKTIGGKETLDTKEPLPDRAFPTVKSLDESEPTAVECTIGFRQGLPVHLDGVELKGPALMEKIGALAEKHGYGRDYHIGTSIVGLKARIGFEAPAMKLLIKAHGELEKIILTSQQQFWKNHIGTVYGNMLHEGYYFEPLLTDIEAFLDSASEYVEGEVRVKLYKGSLDIVSLSSKYSLFQQSLGTYGEKMEAWSGEEAKAFSKFYGVEGIHAHQVRKGAKQ